MSNYIQNHSVKSNLSATKPEPEALMLSAYTQHQQGKPAQALDLYKRVLHLIPNHFDALHLSGIAANQLGNPQLATDLIGKAIQVNPNNATAYANLGLALQNLHRYEEAIANYDLSLLIDPENAFIFYNLGNIFNALENYEKAVNSYQRALQIEPENVAALNNLGVVLHGLSRFEEAQAAYEQALRIDRNNAQAFYNRGNTLNALGRHEEALVSFDNVLRLMPEHPEVLNNRGNTLRALNRVNEAIISFDNALSVALDYADAHWNKSLCLLLKGDYANGWQEYEWRWRSELQKDRRDFPKPRWTGGEDLQNKTILLHAEQGFGDTLQFCRYVTLVSALGATILLEVQPPLKRLLNCLGDRATIFARGEALPEFDYHCPLLSLSLAFQTSLNTIPAPEPYISSNKVLMIEWQFRLGKKIRPRVGIVWSGRVEHKNGGNRSIPLNEFFRLLDEKAEYHILQKEIQPAHKLLLKQRKELKWHKNQIKDFADTAALVELMDIVITVDTSVAHLAAAMGKTVWILLPFSPDWRWLLEGESSPWYPSVRLFRQSTAGDWGNVINRVNDALKVFLDKQTKINLPVSLYPENQSWDAEK